MFDEIFQRLKARPPLAPLCPTRIWDENISRRILNASDTELFGDEAQTESEIEMRAACRAALLLMNDDLKNSHTTSQGIETPTGSFWHAIMHRREGDFSNANYWWRKTGNHAAFDDVYHATWSTLQGENDDDAKQFLQEISGAKKWLPEKFVAFCEKSTRQNSSDEWLRKIQAVEMTALLDWCRAQV